MAHRKINVFSSHKGIPGICGLTMADIFVACELGKGYIVNVQQVYVLHLRCSHVPESLSLGVYRWYLAVAGFPPCLCEGGYCPVAFSQPLLLLLTLLILTMPEDSATKVNESFVQRKMGSSPLCSLKPYPQ